MNRSCYFFSLCLLISCTKKNDKSTLFSININADSFQAVSEINRLELTSNVSWTMITTEDCLSGTPSNGGKSAQITQSASENKTPAIRKAKVIFTSGREDNPEVNITENTDYIFTIDLCEALFTHEKGEASVTVTSTSSLLWNASSNSEWLPISPLIVLGTETLTIVIFENESTNERRAVVALHPEIGESIELDIVQDRYSEEIETVKYAAISGVGNGTRDTKENATDSLSEEFWHQVNNELERNNIIVQLTPRTHSRSFTEKSLTLKNIGNPTNRLILSGGYDVRFNVPEGYPDKSQIILIDHLSPYPSNDIDPGDEYFSTNYSFTNNKFSNKNTQMTTSVNYFGHWGFTTNEFKYLLTSAGGELLLNGSKGERNALLKCNFGIDMLKVRIANNIHERVINQVAFISRVSYGQYLWLE